MRAGTAIIVGATITVEAEYTVTGWVTALFEPTIKVMSSHSEATTAWITTVGVFHDDDISAVFRTLAIYVVEG